MFQPSWPRNLPMILQQKLAALEASQSSSDVPNRQEDRKVDMELLPVRNSVHPVLWFLDILSHFIPTDFHGRKSGSHATLRSQWVAVRAHEGWLKGPCSMKVWMDMESGEKDSYLYCIFTTWALDHVSVPHCTIMVCEVPAKISEVNACQCYVFAYLGGDSMGFHGIPMCVGQVMSCDDVAIEPRHVMLRRSLPFCRRPLRDHQLVAQGRRHQETHEEFVSLLMFVIVIVIVIIVW